MKLKKSDNVMVLAGRDKGKTGRVIEVIREKSRVVVEGVMMIKRHTKANPAKQIKGGIAEREAAIHISNVMLLTAGGVPTRVGYKTAGEGTAARWIRVARKTGEQLDKK